MKLTSLSKLLRNKISCEDFVGEFRESIFDFEEAISKTGSAIDIVVEEDVHICIDRNDILVLCKLFMFDKIKTSELSYIADALQLCEAVDLDSEYVADIVVEFTDPEINGIFTKRRAEQIINENI